MKTVVISVIAVALSAGAAFAAQQRLTDVDYINAGRCTGIARTLASVDAQQFGAVMRAERGVRADYIVGQADQAFEKARREAKREGRREALAQELAGPCQAYLAAPSSVARK